MKMMKKITALFTVFLLSACANTWSAKVTTYENWPNTAFNAPYFIQPAPDNLNRLQYEAVADNVRVAMGAVGLVEGGPESRLQVSLLYGNPISREMTQGFAEPYPYFNNGFYPNTFMWGGFGYGYNRSYGGGFYNPPLVYMPVNVYHNKLQVVIKDKAAEMAEIYNVTAIHESGDDDLMASMPYLARAAFTDFPGMNGKTQYIKIKRNQ